MIIKIQPNDIFGNYKVLKRDTDKQTAAAYWVCECLSCKKIKSIRATQLRKGPKCNCARSASLIGQEINGFKVIEITNKRAKDKSIILKCQCLNCNNIQEIASNILKSNRKICSNCGEKESTLIDITGQRFGKLTVLKRDISQSYMGHQQDAYWICQCDCGTIKTIRGVSLRKGLTFFCGCIKSKGEEKIASLLKENNIQFKREYSFPDLVYKLPLRFDFAIFNKDGTLSHLLQFDGEQHFNKNSRFYSDENILKDNMKNYYCKQKNIKLIRIKYNEDITLNKIMGDK